MRPALSREGHPHCRWQGERDSRGVRRLRRMREGVSRPREEDQERPRAPEGARRVRREAVRVHRAEFRRLLQGRDDLADRRRSEGGRFRRRERDGPWRGVGERARLEAPSGNGLPARHFVRLPGGRGHGAQVPARLRRLHLAAALARPRALPPHQGEVRTRGEGRVLRTLCGKEERVRRASRRTGAGGPLPRAGAVPRRAGHHVRRGGGARARTGRGRALLLSRGRHERHAPRRQDGRTVCFRIGPRGF